MKFGTKVILTRGGEQLGNLRTVKGILVGARGNEVLVRLSRMIPEILSDGAKRDKSDDGAKTRLLSTSATVINYVPHKPINYRRIKSLLKQSEQAHTFTNNGPVKQLLEQHLHRLFGLTAERRVVCVSSGTAALYLLISLFEKRARRNLRWVTTAFNFPTPVVGRLKTEVVDITNSLYPSIPLEKIENFDGIIIPTLFGTCPALLDILNSECLRKQKILILDNASSPLSNYTIDGKKYNINQLGTAAIGSLHHTKSLGAGEGGLAVVPSEMYDEVNYLANFGFDDERRHHNLGCNAKMSDIAAAFVLSHIENYDIKQHIEVQNKYINSLKEISGIDILGEADDIVYGNMPVIFQKPINHLVFRDVGIETNRYYKPLLPLPNSVDLFSRIVNFPLYSTLTDHQLGIILKKIEIEAKKQ